MHELRRVEHVPERLKEEPFLQRFPIKPVEWPLTGLSDDGGLDCYKSTELVGVLVGDATVRAGAQLIVRGMITGNVMVEAGAVVFLHGVVCRDVTVYGAVAIYGVICGALHENGESVAYVSGGSVIAT